jgi:hypothetical protein
MMSISPLTGHTPYESSRGIIQIATIIIWIDSRAYLRQKILTRPNPISGGNSGTCLQLSIREAEGVDGVQASGGDWVQDILRVASAHASKVPFLGATEHAFFSQILSLNNKYAFYVGPRSSVPL